MIEHRIVLAQGGAALLPDHGSTLHFGYTKNRGIYRLCAECQDEWEGLTIRVFWHLPDGNDPPSSLLVAGLVDVPASVTAQPGEGWVTFEGSDGTRTVTSADVRYRVGANHGTDDGTLPEPNTPAWQEFVRQVVAALAVDATLTQLGKAADAKAVGDRFVQTDTKLTELSGRAAGLTAAEKQLLLTLFQNAAYSNDNMRQTYDALAALWDQEV